MSYLGTNKIGKMYLGSTAIGKAYLGSNLVYQKGGVQPTMIPYIRGGHNGSYINTGITPDDTTKVIVWARNVNPAAGWFFGGRIASQNSQIGLFLPTTNPGAIRCLYYNNAVYDVNDQFTNLSGYHKYELYQGVLKVDDVVQASGSTGTFSCPHNLYLFGMNTAGTLASPTLPIDICACQIYKNDVLVRDYTAVNSPSAGLYDSVSQTLFTNAGSGNFTYGEFDKNAYTPLEYIECSGAQYFDSGIKGSNSLNYVVKFRNGGTSAWPDLFLAQTSKSSKRYGLAFGNSTTPNSVVYFTFNTANKNYAYGSSFAGKDLVALKSGVDHYLYENNVQKTKQTHTAATFSTDYNIFVGAGNNAGTTEYYYTGRMHYLGFGSSRNFVPGKKGSLVGMYDTYNDVFYPSVTETPFIAGPTI